MAEFKSWRSFWDFEQAVKKRMRYVHNDEVKHFLETVRQTAEKRGEKLPMGKPLWRAQLGVKWEPKYEGDDLAYEVPWPYARDRMKPLRDQATEGRANPKGIPCLYLATDRDTAIAEVRPWIGSCVSVGLFKTNRELRVVNCAEAAKIGGALIWFLKEPPAEQREESVWRSVNESFARPVTPSENAAGYAPTQIIAELFKVHGYDGIAYRSSVSETGHNVALFDLDAAEIVEGQPFHVEKVSFQAREIENPVRYQ